MRAILSKVLIFGSLRGAFFMDVREADRKTENGGGTTGREKLRNRRKAVRARTGKADKQKGSRATNERGKWTTASGRAENSS